MIRINRLIPLVWGKDVILGQLTGAMCHGKSKMLFQRDRSKNILSLAVPCNRLYISLVGQPVHPSAHLIHQNSCQVRRSEDGELGLTWGEAHHFQPCRTAQGRSWNRPSVLALGCGQEGRRCHKSAEGNERAAGSALTQISILEEIVLRLSSLNAQVVEILPQPPPPSFIEI